MNNRISKYVFTALLLAIFLAAAVWAYNHFAKPQPVTYMPQQQAETAQGVQEAANNAEVHISPGQAAEVAQAIHEATSRPPDQVVTTTGAGMTQALASVQGGAQLQIVTDPSKPDQKPDKPKPDQPVNLNVYNIKAYSKTLDQATLYLRFDGITPKPTGGDLSRSWLVSKSGHYIGVGLSYDEDRARGKLRGEFKYTHAH